MKTVSGKEFARLLEKHGWELKRVTGSAFSMAGMIWVFGLACLPLGYLFLLPVFLSFDPSLEESAYIAGSKPVHTMMRIIFPLAAPAFLSAFVLNFLRGLRSFETPVLQGTLGNIKNSTRRPGYTAPGGVTCSSRSPCRSSNRRWAERFLYLRESIRNVDVAVLLTAPGKEYRPVTLFEYFRVGQWAEASAGGVIYLIILIVAVSVAKFAFKMKFSL